MTPADLITQIPFERVAGVLCDHIDIQKWSERVAGVLCDHIDTRSQR